MIGYWSFITDYRKVTQTFIFGFADCATSLGMESGEIPDEDLSASSSFDVNVLGPHNGR
jgi:hypothetical protein